MKKVMSAIYYRKVFERFDRRQNSTFNVKNGNQISTPTSASTMAPPPRKNKCFTKEEKETNKKREVKNELKEPQKVVDSFILSKSKIGSRSADVYKQVCQYFLISLGQSTAMMFHNLLDQNLNLILALRTMKLL